MAQQQRSIFNPFTWFGGNEPSLEDKIEQIINRRNESLNGPTEDGSLVQKDAKSLSVANILAQLKAKVLSVLAFPSAALKKPTLAALVSPNVEAY